MIPPIATEAIVDALRTVLDPEVGINVIDLGLVYGIEWQDHNIRLTMTMTSSTCPLGAYLRESAERAIRARVPDAKTIEITLVWQPAWEPSMMSPEARRQMGWRS
ncbi:MAG: metal-sulfur cluster assembly factor [Acidobacteria bacterium]|nr:metal-sulfur cluster assembly factor [Acidobacteriota bacterium]